MKNEEETLQITITDPSPGLYRWMMDGVMSRCYGQPSPSVVRMVIIDILRWKFTSLLSLAGRTVSTPAVWIM